jgi:asparagine synthase (glutamine-hydrolysing)
MCGINGVFCYGGGRPDRSLIERQSDALHHRGPDDSGFWSEGACALGHRRLSIVDLSPGGHQPMPNEDGSVWVTFNGELYGVDAIRRDLESRGHRFRGHSDTELLVHLYEEMGEGLLARLRGKFAFALFDAKRQRLLIARDRLGIKPLIYHDDGKRIAFASEIHALMLDPSIPREVDERALSEYLAFQYIPSPRTIWANVRKLPPGHFAICDANGVRCERYWSLPTAPARAHDESYFRDRLRERIADAVKVRLVADVPIGAFLSGGLDSAAVVAWMVRQSEAPVRTFTIGFFENEFSEIEAARRTARHLGTEHQEFMIAPDAMEALPRLIEAMGEPFADASILPTYFVSQIAARELKVVLSGDGGDEAFGGYKTYPAALKHARLAAIPSALRQLAAVPSAWMEGDDPRARKMRRVPMSLLDRHIEVMAPFPPRELAPLLAPGLRELTRRHDPFADYRDRYRSAVREAGDLGALLHLDTGTFLADDVLRKVDSASMLNSLEVRCPLLDHELMEFVATIPIEYKLRGGVTKWILREAMRDQLPPECIAGGKKGFTVPLERWFGGAMSSFARDVLLDPRARSRGWLEMSRVERLVARGGERDGLHARQIWTLVNLELWAHSHLDAPPAALRSPSPSAETLSSPGGSS